MKKFTSLEETIYFWTRNDSVIINNLLCGNIDEALKWAENAAINDNKGILKEYEDGVRINDTELDEKMIASLQSRLFEYSSDAEKKEKILEVARNDILNILTAMKTTENEMLLYRTVWHGRTEIDDVLSRNVNDIVEFKNISSTCCIAPIWENKGKDFYKYEITVPKNRFILELDQFKVRQNYHGEEGEVLLPPMKCRIKNMRSDDNENCKGIIELEYLEKLPVSIAE
jgi:hypothetical protein